MLLSLVYLGFFYSQHHDFFYKDVSLSGGTTVTIMGDFDTSHVETTLNQKFQDINFRKLTDLTTGKQLSFIVESYAEQQVLVPEI